MKIGLSRFVGVWRVTVLGVKPKEKAESTRETEKKSTTTDSIVPEVWIMLGLLLGLLGQTVNVNPLLKLGEKQDIDSKENND